MAFLFNRTFVLHATCPLSFDSDFRHLRLHLYQQSPTGETQFASHHLTHYLFSLCCRINTAIGLKGIAISYDEDSLSVVCQAQEKGSVERIITHLDEKFPLKSINCTPPWPSTKIKIDDDLDDTIGVGLLMTRALECALVRAFTQKNWTSLDGNVLVNGNVAFWDEATPLEAVSVVVQPQTNSKITIFLSPDVVQFRRFKVTSILSESTRRDFDDGCEVNFKYELLKQTPDSLHSFKCVVLPSRQEGYIVGCSKNLPKDMDCDYGEQWKSKYNMMLPTDFFYVKVYLTCDVSSEIWVPSCLVLTRPGLVPVCPSIRLSNITCVIDSFRHTISGWNFFDAGQLMFEASGPAETIILSENHGWTCAKDVPKLPTYENIEQRNLKPVVDVFSNLIVNNLKDFRRPKPVTNQGLSTREEENIVPKKTTAAKAFLDSGNIARDKFVPRFTAYRTFEAAYGRTPAGQKARKVPCTANSEVLPKKEMSGLDERKSCESNRTVAISKDKILKNTPTRSTTVEVIRPDSLIQSGLKPASNKPLNTFSLPKKAIPKHQEEQNKSMSGKEKSSKRPSSSMNEGNASGKENVRKHSKKTKLDQVSKIPNQATSERIEPVLSSVDAGVKSCLDSRVVETMDNARTKHENDSSLAAIDTTQKITQKKAVATIDAHLIKEKVQIKNANGKLNELTVAELKAFLSANKAKVSGKKEELIQRVRELIS